MKSEVENMNYYTETLSRKFLITQIDTMKTQTNFKPIEKQLFRSQSNFRKSKLSLSNLGSSKPKSRLSQKPKMVYANIDRFVEKVDFSSKVEWEHHQSDQNFTPNIFDAMRRKLYSNKGE